MEIITANQARNIANQFNIRNHELFCKAMSRINADAKLGKNSTFMAVEDVYRQIVNDVVTELRYLGYNVYLETHSFYMFLIIEW